MNIFHAKQNSTHNPDFHWHFQQPRNYYLLVIFHVPTIIQIDDSYKSLPSETCVIFDKTAIQDYRPAGAYPFCHDFMQFDLISDEASHAFSGIPLNTPFQLYDTDQASGLIKSIMQSLLSDTAHTSSILSNLGKALLYILRDALQLDNTLISCEQHFKDLYQLRSAIYLYPSRAWSIQTMCSLSHLSPAYLQSLYRRFFHVSCTRDVIQARIKLAKSLLQYTSLSVTAIGETCGYSNPEHFIRQFRNNTKTTPLQYRKQVWAQD